MKALMILGMLVLVACAGGGTVGEQAYPQLPGDEPITVEFHTVTMVELQALHVEKSAPGVSFRAEVPDLDLGIWAFADTTNPFRCIIYIGEGKWIAWLIEHEVKHCFVGAFHE